MAAQRGRDLTLTLATDLRRFETDRAADDLEDLGRAAHDAGDDLDDLDDQARRTARALDDVGDGADRAARDTGQAMGEIRDTSRGAATEISSGFDGSFDSVIGGLQGMVAEMGVALGPGAMAGLMGGALAIGAVYSQITGEAEKATERISGLRDRIRELSDTGAGLDTAGLRDYLDELETTDLARIGDDATRLGVSVETLARARYGEAGALREVTAAQDAQNAAIEGYDSEYARLTRYLEDRLGLEKDVTVGGLTLVDVTQDTASATRQLAGETEKATEAEAVRAAALGGLTDAQLELNDALTTTFEGIVDASDDVESAAATSTDSVIAAAKAQADATADMADTWADYAGSSAAAADEIIAEQQRQIAKLEEFQTNTQAVLTKGGEDLVAWANQQTDAPAAMAAAAQMTPDQASQIATNYRTTVELAGAEMIKGTETALAGTDKPAKTAGEKSGKAYADGFVKAMNGEKRRMQNAAAVPITGNPWIDNQTKRVP